VVDTCLAVWFTSVLFVDVCICACCLLLLFSQVLTRHTLIVKRIIQTFQQDIDILRRKPGDQHEEIDTKEAEILKLESILDQLETSMSVLDAENQRMPFKIFGAPADSSLLTSAISILTSYYGALLALFASDSKTISGLQSL
jgi:hypothetical protein